MSARGRFRGLWAPLELLLLAVAASAAMPTGAAEPSAGSGEDGPLVLLADRALQPDGQLKQDVAVVVQGGKIRRVLTAADVQGQEVRRLGSGSVLCPGLIDLCASIGAVGQAVTTAHTIDPEASAVDALDPRHKDFAVALDAGITTAMVNPAPTNLVCGTCVTFRTLVTGERLDVLRDDGPLVFSLGERVWQQQRAPTSRAGALHDLRGLLADARAAEAHDRVNAAVAGRADALIFCQTEQDVFAARTALGELADHFVLVHNDDALDLATEARRIHRPVVVGPYTFASSRRVMLGAAALAARGVDVAFRGGFPASPPEGLRITAALAVRHGMDPAKARQAMTSVPAKVAGLAGQIGTLTPGNDADLVVFSGDPLRLDSTVQEVYVRGVRVYTPTRRTRSAGGAL